MPAHGGVRCAAGGQVGAGVRRGAFGLGAAGLAILKLFDFRFNGQVAYEELQKLRAAQHQLCRRA